RSQLARAFVEAVHRPSSGALQYGWPEGSFGLRRWVALRLRARGAQVDAEDVIVTSGAQQALAIASECLVSAGDRVLVDPETYPSALDLFRARGAIPTPRDDAAPIACAYVMPGVGNPRGIDLDRNRLDRTFGRGVAVVADEAYADLRFDGCTRRSLLAE